jgi:hypothetical protein
MNMKPPYLGAHSNSIAIRLGVLEIAIGKGDGARGRALIH